MKKHGLALVIITFILLLSSSVIAENLKLSIVSAKTKEPIEFVNICWQMLYNSKQIGFAISDKNGAASVKLPTKEKVIIAASCIGYKTQVDTILLKDNYTISLKEDVFNLDKVIISGHGKPTTVDKSIYEVRIINSEKIRATGAKNLDELLFTVPNIQIKTDLILGTQLEMLGLKGNNVKIMRDGVPIIGRLDGQLDLSQITLNNVDHIEIIEGPMSVVYGNNALAGTLNIITKKNKHVNSEITVNTGYEDVKSYDFGANLVHKIGRSTFSLSGNYADFKGVDFNKKNREMEWKPKQQYATNLGYSLQFKNWNLDTKASLYKSKLKIKGNIIDFKVFDSFIYTDRYTASANLQGKWNPQNHLNILLSHSYYNHANSNETKSMRTLEILSKTDKVSSQKEHESLLRAIWNHTFKTTSPLSLESGIDFNHSSMEGKRIADGEQRLGDYAIFANLHYSPWENLELQPGIRWAHNTDYDAPLIYSLNAKWRFLENFSWRISAAKGFRAPTVKELYMSFVNSNHEIYGNKNLKAEKSNTYSSSFSYQLKIGKSSLKTDLQFYYNNIENLIMLVNNKNSTGMKFDNIAHDKTTGGNVNLTYYYKNWLRINASSLLTSRYNMLSKSSNTQKFNNSVDWIAGLQIKEPTTKITFTSDFKQYGKQDFFYYDNNNQVKQGRQQAYEVLNASISRHFWQNRIFITIGAKNLTDIKNTKVTARANTGHGNSTAISYGRSFFIRAILKFKNYKY